MAIKSLLREELNSSLEMEESYMRELKALPRGSLIKKKISGREYFYIVSRNNGKVKFKYQGKEVPETVIATYKNAKMVRAKYRASLSMVKKQIKYLKGILRGKEAI
jgi:hypothetical protein